MKTPQQDISDEAILRMLGEVQYYEKGFRLLMDKYQERLYWHVRRMVVGHEDANDVVQNAFIKIFKGIPNFQGKSTLYTWMYRIATNEAITFLQRKKRQSSLSIDNEEMNLAARLQADAYFDGNEAELSLELALHELPEKQRLVFNLRYFDEMNYQDMSDVLGTSVGALKASYHHAVKKIEKHVREVASHLR